MSDDRSNPNEDEPLDDEEVVEGQVESRAQRLWRKSVQLLRAIVYREFIDGRQERAINGFLISLVFHLALMLLLALWGIFVIGPGKSKQWIIANPQDNDELEQMELAVDVKVPSQDKSDNSQTQEATAPKAPNVPSPFAGLSKNTQPQKHRVTDKANDPGQMMKRTWLPIGGGYEGRTKEMRAMLAKKRGGTPASEDAVELALAWLAKHQLPDGSWRFDHNAGPCKGRCRHAGTDGSTTGATGLALLAFMGAGYTHQSGKYAQVVHRGLYYLMTSATVTKNGADLQEGSMYGHGISTLALCEAYAMTKDRQIGRWAQRALDFICYAQHIDGGWRYNPGQPGDTTVYGWQIMSIKSGRMMGLHVPSPVIINAKLYLNSVQSEKGAYYGYLKKGRLPTPTAIGLLTRMYSRWPRTKPQLARGVRYLSTRGPSDHDMYYNYYATQVLSHYDGPMWKKWNQRLRDFLIKKQDKLKHERGSWYFKDKHGKAGGRLYTTAMCCMILEVYYRHMPLYGVGAVKRGF